MGRIKFLNIIYDQSIGVSRMTNKFTNLSEDKMNHRLVYTNSLKCVNSIPSLIEGSNSLIANFNCFFSNSSN